MDSNYSFPGEATDHLPYFTDIVLHNIAVLSPGKLTLHGYAATQMPGITFDGVQVPAGTKVAAVQADIMPGPEASNIVATRQSPMHATRNFRRFPGSWPRG